LYEEIVRSVLQTFDYEIAALQRTRSLIDGSYRDAARLILDCKGKLVLTGVGKSGLVAQKHAATFCSTGTTAIFMDPCSAAHGDLGVIDAHDVLIAYGKSGESNELNSILPSIRKLGVEIIGITGNSQSTLAKFSKVVLDASVVVEACPLNLAPTTSTMVSMAIGDALAVATMSSKGFTADDFARYHPGGLLGRRLTLTLQDVLVPLSSCPILKPSKCSVKEIIVALGTYGLGIVLFSEDGVQLDGILTDGDLRALLDRFEAKIFAVPIAELINRSPLILESTTKATNALSFMEDRDRPLNIVPVVDAGQCLGIVRLHELVAI
jgi:arabinose-5-phosphate isomerase